MGYCAHHFAFCTNMESLCHTPETNVMCHLQLSYIKGLMRPWGRGWQVGCMCGGLQEDSRAQAAQYDTRGSL